MAEATEAAQKLAEERGVDLEAVEGTGSGGNITVDDVRAVADLGTQEEAEAQAGEPQAPPPVRVRLNPRLGSASHQFADGRVFYRDVSTPVSAEDFAELKKAKSGGKQILVKGD